MAIKIATWIIVSAVAGLLYRLGGVGKPYDTKFRDMGVPFVGIVLLLIIYPHYSLKYIIAYLLTFGLYFASMTTYWKRKGSDAKWWNWLLTGLGYSLAFLPFAIVSGEYFGFCLRLVLCSVATMIWSEKIDNVVWEEFGRGVICTATLPLLLI
jgi:hypothetical protein